jgi:hypothetical protein
MKILLLLLTVCFSLCLNSQDLIKKKKKGTYEKEIYFISKNDKKKNGPYLLQRISNNDTLKSGQYRNDSLCGIWSYYSKRNQLYLKFNYDLDRVVFISEKIEKTDSFFVEVNGEFNYEKTDSPPIYIGFEDEIRIAIASSIKVPGNILQNGQSSTSVFSIEIGTDGEITKYSIEQSSDKNLDNQVLQILKDFNVKWIPAQRMGKPVVSKIFLVVRILPQQMASQGIKELLLEKPYIWKVDITYFGVVRTTTLSSPGAFPGSSGMRTR